LPSVAGPLDSISELSTLFSALSLAEQREASERSLYRFVRDAWHVVEPGEKFVDGRHIRVICEALEQVSRGEIKELLINIPPGHMKKIADSTPIATPAGYRRHGDIRPGDYVFGPDGLPTKVLAVSDRSEVDYEIAFTTRETIKCHAGHLWTVYDRWARRWKTLDTATLAAMRRDRGRSRFFVPDSARLTFEAKELPVHPYFIGCWLGDGTTGEPALSHDKGDVGHIAKLESLGFRVTRVSPNGGNGVQSHFCHQGMNELLRRVGILNRKHIPEAYATASDDQRLELLAGLIDTDGHVDRKRGRVRVSTCDEALAIQVRRLCVSLGFRAYISSAKAPGFGKHWSNKTVFQVGFEPDRPIPTALPRKRIHRTSAARRRRAIVDIRRAAEPEMGQCLNVQRPDGLYLVGETNIVTHNSLLVCVFWPAWEWTWNAYRRFMFAAYAGKLSERDHLKCRRIIESDWYQERWGHKFQLRHDLNTAEKFENTEAGVRFATSVGLGTGEGAHHLVIDDPHNASDIHSDTRRNAVPRWYRETWATRQRPPGSGGRVIIMQRLHVGDLAGYVLKRGYRHLCLPFEFDPQHPTPCNLDWRKKRGELLWPEMFTPEKAAKQKADLETEFARAGQLQQRPIPDGGGILKEHWWKIWESKETPKCDIRLMSVDTAYTEKTQNDASAVTIWGRFRDERNRPKVILLYAWQGRLETPDLNDKLEQIATKWKPTRILIENKASGISVMQELRRRLPLWPITAFEPKRYGDKIARAYAVQGLFETGLVYVPDMKFAEMVVDYCTSFPANPDGRDIVDTVTQALLHLRAAGVLPRPDEADTETEEFQRQVELKRTRRLYGQALQ
jgi:predicted phage terminase large subunit-like protein